MAVSSSIFKKPISDERISVTETNGAYHSFDPKCINQINGDGHTYLSYAVAHHYRMFTQVLLEHKADPNQINEFGKLPLIYAVGSQDEQVVKFLLEYKADAYKKDNWGKSAFFSAEEPIRFIMTSPEEKQQVKQP